MRPRRPLSRSTCCVSASPSSHGMPACLMLVSGAAPVPPSWPEIRTTSACAFATPAAIVPTPATATSFTRDARLRIRVLQVVNQLREILDRVDVVVRRRRDQPDARCGIAHLGDPRIHLAARAAGPPSPGLAPCAILIWISSALTRYSLVTPKRARRHLLDRAAAPVAVGVPLVARGIFAPFARVRLAAETVHGDRQRRVRFLADRSVRHRAGREPLDDLVDRLDLLERNRRGRRAEFEQPAQRAKLPRLIVDELRVFLEDRVLPAARRVLELEHRLRSRTGDARRPAATGIRRRTATRSAGATRRRVRLSMARERLGRDLVEPDAADARRGAGEMSRDERGGRCRSLRRSARRSSSAASRCPSSTSPSGCPCSRLDVVLDRLLVGRRRGDARRDQVGDATRRPGTD